MSSRRCTTSGRSADEIVSADGLAQNSDEGALLAIVRDVIADNTATPRHSTGRARARRSGSWSGQVMKGERREGQSEARQRAAEARTGAHMTGETGRGFAPRWNQARSLLAPLLAYLAAAVVTTWPLALHPRSLLGAPSGPGDPFLNLWILGWDMQAVLSDPASLLTGRVFNANIFHPARRNARVLRSPSAPERAALAAIRDHARCRRLLQRAADRVTRGERAGDASVRALGDLHRERRVSRRSCMGVRFVPLCASDPSAAPVAVLSPARLPVSSSRHRGPTAARRDVTWASSPDCRRSRPCTTVSSAVLHSRWAASRSPSALGAGAAALC